MSQIVTEKIYPVESRWLVKMACSYGFAFLLLGGIILAGVYDARAILGLIIIVISFLFQVVLARIFFHYTVEDKYLTLKQGVLKKQEKHVPYGVIQNLYIKQDLLDRLFGLASFIVEDASQGGKVPVVRRNRYKNIQMLGFRGNRVTIVGLKRSNAELLKGVILQKMKENPTENSHSGL
jgi:membrane protein YdbS with pleckstrin-like domain